MVLLDFNGNVYISLYSIYAVNAIAFADKLVRKGIKLYQKRMGYSFIYELWIMK